MGNEVFALAVRSVPLRLAVRSLRLRTTMLIVSDYRVAPLANVVADYKHNRPKSETFGQRFTLNIVIGNNS